MAERHHLVAIIGNGLSAQTAALFAARNGDRPVVYHGSHAADRSLGEGLTIESYPGLPVGIRGRRLTDVTARQAARYGSEIVFEDVITIDLSTAPAFIETTASNATADAVILAMDGTPRRLRLDSEQRWRDRGVYDFAADHAADFQDRTVAVVGGGDSALDQALFCARFARRVLLIVQSDQFRASAVMQFRVQRSDKIEVIWRSRLTELIGDGHLEAVRILDLGTERERVERVDAVFVSIGHDPRTELVSDQLEIAPDGTIAVEPGTTLTSVEGVFACGELIDSRYRQLITCAATGCMAAIDAHRWLSARLGQRAYREDERWREPEYGELVGESAYSARSADHGPFATELESEDLSLAPEDLGRHSLEDATGSR